LELIPVGSQYKSTLLGEKIEKVPIKMDAWVSYTGGDTILEKVQIPTLRPQDVLIEALWISICPSDLKRLIDPSLVLDKAILGHEFAGRIVSVGKEVDKKVIGSTVVVEEHYPCLICDECKKKKFDRCSQEGFLGWYSSGNPDDWVRNGAFAEYVSIHYSCAKEIKGLEGMDFFPSLIEPFGNSVKIERLIKEEFTYMPDTVVLWGGCGLQGSYMASLLSTNGVKNIILIDKNAAGIAYMKDQLKSFNSRFYFLNIDEHTRLSELKEKLGQHRGFINIDLTGSIDVQKIILNHAHPSGTVFFFGLPDDHNKTNIPGTKINLFQFISGDLGKEKIGIGGIKGIRVMGRDDMSWEKTIETLKSNKTLRDFILKPLVLAGSTDNLGELLKYMRINGSRYRQEPYGYRPAKFGLLSKKIIKKNLHKL